MGVAVGQQQWLHEGPGAAQSSASLIPVCLDLLAPAGAALTELDAIVFGRGPGSFTGLRTACAVAQGLAAGAGRWVLPVDTLLAVADEAAHQLALAGHDMPQRLTALLDARMDEVYTQDFEHTPHGWQALSPCRLVAPQALSFVPQTVLAGNAFAVYAERLPALPDRSQVLTASPTPPQRVWLPRPRRPKPLETGAPHERRAATRAATRIPAPGAHDRRLARSGRGH